MVSVVVPLVFLGVAIIVAMMMPMFTTMNVPVSDGLQIVENAFTIFRNNTVATHNVTADSDTDTIFFTEGAGMIITTFYNNDTIRFESTGGGGGEANTGTNVGGQTGQVFRDKSGVTLNFKTISGSGGIAITNNANDIDIGLGALNIENLNNVTAVGCAVGEILKVSGTTWQCGTDNGGGGNTDLLDGSVHQDTVAQTVTRGSIIYGDSTPDWNELVVGGADTFLKSDGTDVSWSAVSLASIHDITNVTSTGCASGQILEVSGTSWICGDKGGGSGVTSINADADPTQVLLGSTDELTVTDTGVGELTFDVGTDIVQIDQANTYENGNMQTFTDDDIQIDNPAGTFQYIFNTNAIVADRIVSFPLLTTGDTFVMASATQTLTTKTFGLGSNTITGTSAQFDTANTDGTFFLNADNISQMATSTTAQFNTANSDGTFVTLEVANTYSDGIKQTFNPSGTNSGLNLGTQAGEPSSPATGDLFYDSTANQFKGRTNVAWIDLGASGGSNALLDGSAHTDTTAQAVTRGSIIYGDATTWNELVLGTSAQMLISDGTDISWGTGTIGTQVTGASTSLTDTAQIAYLNTANTYSDGTKQLFNPSASISGINVGAHTAEPSAPVDGDIFYDSTANQMKGRINSAWIDLGGSSGSNVLLDGSTHTDTVAQTVTRGSLIYGDATPNWNELVIGGANTVLKSDGTDVSWSSLTIGTEVTGASTALTDTANIAYLNTANIFTDSNMQTFHDDFLEIRNPANTFDYIFSTNAIVADRTISIPLLTGNDVFTMQDASQTLTTKTITLGSNTLSGTSAQFDTANTDGNFFLNADDISQMATSTSAQFDTANSDGNFVYEDAVNTWGDGIKQTFNPSATEAGLNAGVHSAEPSSPNTGDIFYDSTAGTLKGYDGAWKDLMGAGGGSNALLDGSAHTDTVAQAVTRGSIIYGDATPNWNELVIGGANTVLKSDGTDVAWSALTIGTEVTGASTALSDTANIAYLNTPNAYVDGNLQTFTDDDWEISNPAGTFQYIFNTNAIVADRIVSFPLLTTGDTFVMASATQTLTTKSIGLGSNTITGTSAQFDTANTDGNFFLNADNISQMATSTTAQFNTANSDGTFVTIEVANTYSDGIKQTFNPSATNAGINVGAHTAEPSAPVDGDVFLDSTANQLKGRINGVWVNLGQSGGGSNALLDGSAHTDTIAQAVTRGSIIYGDATPNWNELVIGGANTVLKSDGTDVAWSALTIGTEVTGASTALTDTANIAYLNTANTWTTGTQNFGSLTITGFDINCDEATSSCINVDTPDFIGVAEPRSTVFTCGGGMSQVTNTPNKRTEDGTQMDYVVCEFDTTTAETIVWSYQMPDNFDGTSTIDVTVDVVVDTGGNTASACFDISFLGLAQDDVVNTAFGAVTGACTGVIVLGDLEKATMSGIASGTHTLNAGETAFIKLARDVAADSNTGDVGVISIEVAWN